jgi:hypothetical protein
MGTTQRIVPGVTGEPNWDNLSSSLTSLANTVEKEQEIEKEIVKAEISEKIAPTEINKKALETARKARQKLSNRHEKHFHSAIRYLVSTGGGKLKVTKGKSSSFGRSGLSTAKSISFFLGSVGTIGLRKTLSNAGFGSIKGKSLQNIIDFLLIYFTDSGSGLDECAANMALCQMMEQLTEDVNDILELEEKLNSTAVDDNQVTEWICRFYGLYLFEHLSQRFQEKITQIKGSEVSKTTFGIIREDILEQVKDLHKSKDLKDIDWKGMTGNKIEEKIFLSIIEIFE